MFQHYINRCVGLHRNAPRIYLDDPVLNSTGFLPGSTYDVVVEDPGSRIVLRLKPQGSRKVSSKERRGRRQSVIDLNSCTDLSGFQHHQTIRIVITQAAVYILITASELNRRERLSRLKERVRATDKPLRIASFAHGIGVMSNAAHQGLTRAGLIPELAFANEIEPAFIEQSMSANGIWQGASRSLIAPMQEVAQDRWLASRLDAVEVLECGIPCSGASKAGKSKRGLSHMEAHPIVGHLVAPLIMIIQQLQPVVVCVENVAPYADSASADILRGMLRDMAYAVHEVVIDSRAHGTIEGRTRWFLVAITLGIDLDLSSVQADEIVVDSTIADHLDSVADDDPRWRTFDYLIAKEERDGIKGNCFAMQLVDAADRSVPTLRKGYHKGGSTDPLLRHPTREGLFRKFTPAEHARFKRIPEELIAGLSPTVAHQGLGQSVAYPVVEALFNRVGEVLLRYGSSSQDAVQPDDETTRRPYRQVATG